jgi:hypothetical protein
VTPLHLPAWTADQWTAFTGASVAGIAALVLLGMAVHTVRSWTTPATYRAALNPVSARPRPSLQLATVRMTNAEVDAFRERWKQGKGRWVHVLAEAGGTAAWTHELPTAPATPLVVDPTGAELAEHLAPGAGSLATLAEVGEGSLMRVELIDPEVARWFADAFDRPAHSPGRTEAGTADEGGVLARFQVAIEPAMRTARLWRVRGEEGPGVGHRALNDWRINCPTGEWPLVELLAS